MDLCTFEVPCGAIHAATQRPFRNINSTHTQDRRVQSTIQQLLSICGVMWTEIGEKHFRAVTKRDLPGIVATVFTTSARSTRKSRNTCVMGAASPTQGRLQMPPEFWPASRR